MYEPETFQNACYETAKEVANLLILKHLDYGPANIAGFGEKGIVVRTWDKVARLKNLLWGDKEPKNESVEDSWQDLAAYAIIALMWRRGYWNLPLKVERGVIDD